MLFFLPLMVISSFVNEQSRFEACQAGTRTDCAPSLVWHLNEWVQQQEGDGSIRDIVSTTSTPSEVSVPSPATSTKTQK